MRWRCILILWGASTLMTSLSSPIEDLVLAIHRLMGVLKKGLGLPSLKEIMGEEEES